MIFQGPVRQGEGGGNQLIYRSNQSCSRFFGEGAELTSHMYSILEC